MLIWMHEIRPPSFIWGYAISGAPPHYPLVDLPLSFALDSLFLPVTFYAEIFH
jgi:uncharacterized protein YceK